MTTSGPTLIDRPRDVLFVLPPDDLHARALAEALLAARLDLRWSDSYRVRPCEPGDLELLARAGCASLTVGVESASERVLKAMVKGHRPEHATEMIREAHQHEILLRVNLLAGYPGETREDFHMTGAWVREHAFAIDDLAPSSFYLTADSPLGRKPERYGIKIRGPRVLQGEGKFRKSPDSLMYDEIDGLTWEEREPLLEQAEDTLRNAWLEGRGALGSLGGLSPSTMLALRRHFYKKQDINDFLLRVQQAPVIQEKTLEVYTKPPPMDKMLRPTLLAPRTIRPPVARAFVAAYRLAIQSSAVQVREGDTLHGILFADGAFLLFRGSVTRNAAGVALVLTIEERIGDLVRMEPTDGRVLMLVKGARIDLRGREAQQAGFARFEVLSFRLDAAARNALDAEVRDS